jgi:hypothetical protein
MVNYVSYSHLVGIICNAHINLISFIYYLSAFYGVIWLYFNIYDVMCIMCDLNDDMMFYVTCGVLLFYYKDCLEKYKRNNIICVI